MDVAWSWRSSKEQHTADNRDCGGIGLRSDAVLAIVLDGSTATPNAGAFAGQIARDLINWFVRADGVVTAQDITAQLRAIHAGLSASFRGDAASYVIALLEREKPALILHAGDCLAGQFDGTPPVDWLIRPHTLANAIEDMAIPAIAVDSVRNRLTRSFRAREFITPDITEISMEGGGALVLATDGFWAALDPQDQVQFLTGEEFAMKDGEDDCSVLHLRIVAGDGRSEIDGEMADNFYVAEQAGYRTGLS
jgi:serine/threonine protein phosphatase PrpC